LASYVAEFTLYQIEIAKGYGMDAWHDDMKKLLISAGAQDKSMVFLFPDTQIANETFLEEVSSILNTGEVPNLYAQEDKMDILEQCAKKANAAGAVTPNEVFSWYVANCRKNLHIVLAMSPIGSAFRTRLRNFPSLVNCCTIDWFMEWPAEALNAVANQFLLKVDMDEKVKEGVVKVMVEAQTSVTELAEAYFKDEKRMFYVTPTSYLDLISSFILMLKAQRESVWTQRMRYDTGIEKIEEAAGSVAALQKDLEDLQPILETSAKETSEMMIRVEGEQKKANEKQKLVDEEATKAEAEGAIANEIKADCEKDLGEAMPALDAAVDALSKLSKGDIGEVKAMGKPPAGVILTCQGMCIMFGVKPAKVAAPDGKGKVDDFWEPAKKELLGDSNLLNRMMNFDKDNISEATIAKIMPLFNDPGFDPDTIKKASLAAMGICKWVRAMVVYDKVAKEVGPKKAKLAAAEKTFSDAMAIVAAKTAELAEVIALVNKLVAELEGAKSKMEQLQNQRDDCASKLVRAEKLITGLGGEKASWAANSKKLGLDYTNLTGDILIAAGICAYLGYFTGPYRLQATGRWLQKLTDLKIPASKEFSLPAVIGDAVKARQWVIDKLPNDSLSVDNAIILDNSRRWPLMIDPQQQANRWVRNTWKDKLKILRLNQNYARTLESCISFGTPTLIENIGLTIDAMLDPLLLKATFKQGSIEMIRLGDSTIEYSKDFKLYFTTKLPNPHYAPEICVAACLLNFVATAEGLTDGLLGVVVAMEEPEIEEQRVALVINSAKAKAELADIENKILALLSASSGDILEDEELIETLASSKITSTRIFEQLKLQEMTQAQITETRTSYTPHSARCAALFFVIADLRIVDPMYQFSLEWFIKMFCKSISDAEAKESKEDRLAELFNSFLGLLYNMVCRSLFAADKLLYSFMLCLKCTETDGELNIGQLNMLLTCVPSTPAEEKPEVDWLTQVSWNRIVALCSLADVFDGFQAEFTQHVDGWKAVFDSDEPIDVEWPNNFKAKCNELQRCLFLFALRTDATIVGIQRIVLAKLGQKFLDVPPFDLPTWFNDCSPGVPMIFILSMGSDPMADVQRLAEKKGKLADIVPVSLGQGQGPKATAAIKEGKVSGKWVLLQNCHLGSSYMSTMETIIEAFDESEMHEDFRLWLTACPSPEFPISVLQNGIKMTVEPPKGLKNSLTRSYFSMDEEWFESSSDKHGKVFKPMLFALMFFHGLILERRNFGPVGWNKMYGFSDQDMDISMKQLRNFLEDFDDIPWAALNYMGAEANYGGRVTDGQDRRAIVVFLQDFYTPKVLEPDYKFSLSGIYYAPQANTIAEHMDYINSLPTNHTPEVFWLHNNANLTAAINEGVGLLSKAVQLMSSFKAKAGGDDDEGAVKEKSQDEMFMELAVAAADRLPPVFDLPAVLRKFPVRYDQCLNTVLLNELTKFNKLAKKLIDTTKSLQLAVKGLVVFSPELEEVGGKMLVNKIPSTWLGCSYPSLKPCQAYLTDYILRCQFIDDWIKQGTPVVFWFSSFFFQQAYLTGVLQNYARGSKLAIDTLMWNYETLNGEAALPTEQPDRGSYSRGLYMQGARWDDATMTIKDSAPKVLWTTVPIIWLKPCEISKDEHDVKHGHPNFYDNPVYKNSDRQGVLSTSGHSSNFIMYLYQPCDDSIGENKNLWTKRGVALITQTDD
jgi:dynein heavy chain